MGNGLPQATRDVFLKIRVTADEQVVIKVRAQSAGKPVSALSVTSLWVRH